MTKRILTLVAPIAAVAALGLSGGAAADTICPPGTTNGAYCVKKCVVPQLKGDTVDQARAALAAHDCRLGKVHRDNSGKNHGVGNGHIYKQSPKAGSVRPAGFKVQVWVQSPKKKHHKKKHSKKTHHKPTHHTKTHPKKK